MKFAFILFGQSVTKKRIEILTPNIKKRGGKILNLEEISWNDETSKEIFVATSTDIKYEVPIGYYDNLNKVVIKLVPDLRSKNINEYCFINCDWISDCLRENQVIDPSNYSNFE